jgi:hypothetical protein
MTNDHDRLAIRAIIEAALPITSREHEFPKKQGPFNRVLRSRGKRKFEMYEGKAGRGWKCMHITPATGSVSARLWPSIPVIASGISVQ